MSSGPAMVSVNGGEPFEADGLTMVWEPAAGDDPFEVVGSQTLNPVSFTMSGELYGWFEQLLHDSPEAQERRAADHRRLWSGPDKLTRQILQAYRLSAAQIGSVPKSAFSPEYRRQQRARVKRRRR